MKAVSAMFLLSMLAVCVTVSAFPNPFALGTQWPRTLHRHKFYMADLQSTTVNPWADIVNSKRSEIKAAISTAKSVFDATEKTTILNNAATFFPTRYYKQIQMIYNALSDDGKKTDITLSDLILLNVWYDFSVGDASTTLIVRKPDDDEGHPIFGFSWNAGAVENTNKYTHRSKTQLQDLVVAIDYMDRDTEVHTKSTVTLAGWVGVIGGVTYTGAESFAATYAANYQDAVPKLADLISGFTNHYVLPSIYLRELIEGRDNYNSAINYITTGVATKLPIFMSVVGSGSNSATIYSTDGDYLTSATKLDIHHHMMLQDSTKIQEAITATDKWLAVRKAVDVNSNLNRDGFLKNVLSIYPIRDEDTVLSMYADPTDNVFEVQAEKCEYIKSFNDHAKFIIEACNNPPAPVNLAIPALSVVIFIGVISMAVYGYWERRRQMKLIKAGTKTASAVGYTPIDGPEVNDLVE
ncbi:acid ceramidase precursor [Carpediemonas membranifera]|uniref:Acid ceramidase n=1 Tax=Carpediemonas membranifera TaxID=201153 RepID=A0A8J6DZE1_9EUKA|nr:acid ceramidase precursor [Carpediemonas membranifera]|eukprot:KAG9390593.1 acid ceramidase precursor [Carpediemonas membranifera]